MNDYAVKAGVAAGLLVLTVLVRAASRNRLVRRKLVLTLVLLLAFLAIIAALSFYPFGPSLAPQIWGINQLVMALAVINLIVVVAINPLREDRVPERFPTIVQDTIIIGALMVVGTMVMGEKFMTTSAVGAVVVGFALQDTLGNMFAGLAIQVEKPFRVGHWISVGSYEGLVTEVTWRATKMRTKAGNQVILPNSFLSKEAIVNYSEPAAPTRLDVVVGVSYDVPPEQAKAALVEAVANAPLVSAEPAPDVLLDEFAASSVNYRIRFWITDFSKDSVARDQVRTAIYYALRRRGYEIPFPHQIEYVREEHSERPVDRLERLEAALKRVELFAPLSDDQRNALASRASDHLFATNDAIVREGDAGRSMFIVLSGAAKVTTAAGVQVATYGAGDYFGEMALLTGQPRSATVTASSECAVIELTADALREVALANPDVLRRISEIVAARRADLDKQQAESARARQGQGDASRSLLSRIQAFLGLPDLFD
jgi:small-conductance mechanosensitive channel/CRP-like cAMP-binding protein